MYRPTIASLLLAVLSSAAQAQSGESMEQRLRAQLQSTTTQLQQAQAELARLRQPSAAPAAPAASDELQQLKRQLQAEQGRQGRGEQQARQLREQLANRDRQLEQQSQELQQLRLQQNSSREREQALANQRASQEQDLLQCRQRNQALYAIGQEVLSAYEQLGMAGVMRRRQPFAAQSRARYEQWAQEQGDRMYQSQVGARALPPASRQDIESSRATGGKDEPSEVVPKP